MADTTNLIIKAKMGVYNEGSVQISGDGYTFQELEKVRYQLMEDGYKCEIVEDLKELFLVVSRKVESK